MATTALRSPHRRHRTVVRTALATGLALALLVGEAPATTATAAATRCGPDRAVPHVDACVSGTDRRGAALLRAARAVRAAEGTRTTMVSVWAGGRRLLEAAIGAAQPGVPATRDLHLRIGNTTETFMTTLLLQLVDRHRLRLTDTIDRWFPSLPDADRITVDMLARSTSGLADYVRNDTFVDRLYANPFRAWSANELVGLGTVQAPRFAPGASWGFSDTNFVLLGEIVRRVGGAPISRQLQQRILGPLRLRQTQMHFDGAISPPVLHGYTSERGVYEDSTAWNVSWARYTANMTSTLHDLARWGQALGTGRLLSPRSARLQTGSQNVGLGVNTPALHYAMGLGVAGGWVVANPQLQGYNGVVAHLPSRDLTVVVFSTQNPGNSPGRHYATVTFLRLARALTGRTPPLSPGPRQGG